MNNPEETFEDGEEFKVDLSHLMDDIAQIYSFEHWKLPIVENVDNFIDEKEYYVARANVEVRISMKIHDRYLISGDRCWSIGASIKDLGNKDTVIKEISEVTDSLEQLFMERWNESEIVT